MSRKKKERRGEKRKNFTYYQTVERGGEKKI